MFASNPLKIAQTLRFGAFFRYSGTSARSARRNFRTLILNNFQAFATPVLCSVLFLPHLALALPWDTDMAKQQSLKANEIARNPVEGTVPRGIEPPFKMTTPEAEKSLRNPTQTTPNSIARGKRLYSSNCVVCHGPKARAKGTVSEWMGVPDLTSEFYRGSTDGRVFAIIHNGGAAMPRYGYKFSRAEIWDIVNYLRRLQGIR